MSIKVTVEIKKCTECNHCRTNRDYTEDSFEFVERWDCHHPKYKMNGRDGKNIRRYVDWTDKDDYIPEWCPLLK